jgi:hypothetical protein
MKPRIHGSTLVLIRVLIVLVAFSVVTSGCSKGASASAAKIVDLSTTADGGDKLKLPDETETLTLASGQTLGVRSAHRGGPGYWSELNAGDIRVMAPGETVTVIPCPAHSIGCFPTIQKIYTARAPGKSTIVWTFRGVDPEFPAPASQPRLPCSSDLASQGDENTPQCPIGIVRIIVTVT